MKRQSIIRCLESTWFEVQLQLERLGRKECMHKVFCIGFRRLSAYYEIRHTDECDMYVNEAFRRYVRREYEDGELSVNFMRIFIRTANAVDNHMSGRRVDIVCNKQGEVVPAMMYPDEKHDLGFPWASIAEEYCNWLVSKGWGDRAATHMVTKASLLFGFCEVNGLKGLEQLTFQYLAEFLVLAVGKGEPIRALKRHITLFLEFASSKGFLLPAIMDSMFSLRVRNTRRILPSFTAPEINAMLASIDLSTEGGLRDLAIIILAATTGIRGCDIIAMRLDAYDRVHKTLHFTQKKTGVPVMLPVVEVAASALNAYIDQARPVTSACNLFVTVRAPYTAVRDMNSILKPIMARAGIRKEKGKGFHAFRRALGGMLLNNGVKIGLISQILGHTNMASVDRYLPYAVTSLKSCIMDMPPMERKKEVST